MVRDPSSLNWLGLEQAIPETWCRISPSATRASINHIQVMTYRVVEETGARRGADASHRDPRSFFLLFKRLSCSGFYIRYFAHGLVTEPLPAEVEREIAEIGARLEEQIRRKFYRSLTIREVDAGSCNGCELEVHAMNNAVYNCERFGIHFTASPRFADMLLVTGPVSVNMEIALKRTYAATPNPKLVVAVGDCACDGGIFGESYTSLGRVSNVIPVDAHIPVAHLTRSSYCWVFCGRLENSPQPAEILLM